MSAASTTPTHKLVKLPVRSSDLELLEREIESKRHDMWLDRHDESIAPTYQALGRLLRRVRAAQKRGAT